ncbi:hypothetical protein GCM10023350_33400 [Nocardioides endophyticus]|uniref:CHAT domain-containing protein n=1 Tax=Nocardioides endophyticus TaxID=1353775 RepID=A0ABP8Z3Y5_9ACTN
MDDYREIVDSFNDADLHPMPESLLARLRLLSESDWSDRWMQIRERPDLADDQVIAYLERSGESELARLLERVREVGPVLAEPELQLLTELLEPTASTRRAQRRLLTDLEAAWTQIERTGAHWLLPTLIDVVMTSSQSASRRQFHRFGRLAIQAASALFDVEFDLIGELMEISPDSSQARWAALAEALSEPVAVRAARVLVVAAEVGPFNAAVVARFEDRAGLALAVASRDVESVRSELEAVTLARAAVLGKVEPRSLRGEFCLGTALECLEQAQDRGASWLVKPGLNAADRAHELDVDTATSALVAARLRMEAIREGYLPHEEVHRAISLFRQAWRVHTADELRAEIANDLGDALAAAVGWRELPPENLVEALRLSDEALRRTTDPPSRLRASAMRGFRLMEAARAGHADVEDVGRAEPAMREFVSSDYTRDDPAASFNHALWLASAIRMGALPHDRWSVAIAHFRKALVLLRSRGRGIEYRHQLAVALVEAAEYGEIGPEGPSEANGIYRRLLREIDTDDSDYVDLLLSYARSTHISMMRGADLQTLTDLLDEFRRHLESLVGDWRPGQGPPPFETGSAGADGRSETIAFVADTLSGLLYEGLVAGVLGPEAVEETVALGRLAVMVGPSGSAQQAAFRGNLAGKITAAVNWRELPAEALTEAVALGRDAIAMSSPDDPSRPIYFTNLSGALFESWRLANAPDQAAHEAIRLQQQAVDAAPVGSPDRANHLTNLATVTSDVYEDRPDSTEYAQALATHREALAVTHRGSTTYLQAIYNYGHALAPAIGASAAETWTGPDAVAELRRVVDDVWHTVRYTFAHPSRRLWAVKQGHKLLAHAPLRLGESGHIDDAITTIEASRGTLMTSFAAPPAPQGLSEAVTLQYQQAAASYTRVQEGIGIGIGTEAAAVQAGDALVAAIETIRRNGAPSFAMAPSSVELASRLDPGECAAYVMAGEQEGMALLLFEDRTSARVALPGLTDRFVSASVEALLERRTSIQALARSLHSVFARPILQAFDDLHREVDTLTVVAVGRVGILPLHAAGDSESGWLDEHYNLRYSTSMRRPDDAGTPPARGAFAAISSGLDLSYVEGDELVLNHYLLRDRAQFVPLKMHEVGSALTDAALCFMSGHALHARDLGSGLVLDDGILSAGELAAYPRRPRKLAVLNACSSGQIATSLPDESIGVHAALLSLGFTGVVASFWPLRDSVALIALAKFAQLVSVDGLECSQALSRSRRWLRGVTAGELRPWIEGLASAVGMTEDLRRRLTKSIAAFPDGAVPFADPADWAPLAYFGRDISPHELGL